MAAWYLVAALGAILVLVGLVALFRIKTQGENSLSLFGQIEIKSVSQGGFICAMGVALVLVGMLEATRTAGSHVTAATLTTDADQGSVQYNVRCPITVGLKAEITLTGDAGDVSYRLEEQDGLDGPITRGMTQVIAFDKPGTRAIALGVPVTVPEGTVAFSERLRVISPTEVLSEPVEVQVTCNPNLPPQPPFPPPSITAPPPGG